MKKFVKGLLVSGFAVALLAGCSNKSKSSECPVCPPVPEPETKNAWTDEELEILDYYYHDEIPFACELSLEGVEDGVLYAVSKDEVSDEDLLAYDDMFQEDGHFKIYNVGPVTGGLSLDVGELGFDLSGDVFQYYRPYMDEAGYSLTRFYTIGLNEDGHLQVAMSASLTPLFSLSNGKIGTGGLYSMLFDDEEGEEFNFLNEYYIWAAQSNVSSQAGSPTLANPFYYLTKYVFPDLLVKETDTATHYTLGSYDSLAAYAPFTSGNVFSDEFDSKFSITLADFDVAGNKLSNFYTEEDYQGVLDWFDAFINAGIFEVVDASMEEGEHGPEASMLVKDTYGFTSEFTVSFLTYGEGEDVETYLEFDYELVDYKLVASAPFVADAFLEEIDSSFDVSTMQISANQVTGEYTAKGYIAYAESENYTLTDALEDVVDTFKETGIAKEYELTFEAAAEDDIYVTAYYKDDTTEVTLEANVFAFVIDNTPAIVTYVTATDRNAVGTYLYGEDVELLSNYYTAVNYWLNDSYGPYITNYVKSAKAAIDAELGMARFGNLAGLDNLVISGFEALNAINGITQSGNFLDQLFGCTVDVTTGEITWTGTYSSTIFQYAAQYIENEEYYTPEDIDKIKEAYGLGVKGAYLGKTNHRYYAYILIACQQLDQLMESIVPWSDQANAYLAEKWTYQESDYSEENWATIQALYAAIPEQWSRSDFKQVVDGAVALADAVPTKAEEELAAYKQERLAALNTLFAGYQEADYYEADWTALNTAYTDGQTAISAATDKDGVDSAYGACKDAMDAVPTKAAIEAERTTKLSELDAAFAGYNESDYSEDNWAILVQAYNDGKDAINSAMSIEAIDSACEEAKAAMANVLPEGYKANKLAELQTLYQGYVNPYEPGSTQYEAITEYYNYGVQAINVATTVGGVDSAFESCDNAMKSIK